MGLEKYQKLVQNLSKNISVQNKNLVIYNMFWNS